MTPEELAVPVTQPEMAELCNGTKGHELGDIARRMSWEIDRLRKIIERFPCSAYSHSFHHVPEQWRMCSACSAKKAMNL